MIDKSGANEYYDCIERNDMNKHKQCGSCGCTGGHSRLCEAQTYDSEDETRVQIPDKDTDGARMRLGWAMLADDYID